MSNESVPSDVTSWIRWLEALAVNAGSDPEKQAIVRATFITGLVELRWLVLDGQKEGVVPATRSFHRLCDIPVQITYDHDRILTLAIPPPYRSSVGAEAVCYRFYGQAQRATRKNATFDTDAALRLSHPSPNQMAEYVFEDWGACLFDLIDWLGRLHRIKSGELQMAADRHRYIADRLTDRARLF